MVNLKYVGQALMNILVGDSKVSLDETNSIRNEDLQDGKTRSNVIRIFYPYQS